MPLSVSLPDSYVCIVAALSSAKDLFSSYSNERASACQRKRLECFHTISCFAEHMMCWTRVQHIYIGRMWLDSSCAVYHLFPVLCIYDCARIFVSFCSLRLCCAQCICSGLPHNVMHSSTFLCIIFVFRSSSLRSGFHSHPQ